MEKLLEILGNAHFEAYVGGPLAGFVVGLIFSAFGSRPPPGNTLESPTQTRINIDNRQAITHIHHHAQSTRIDDDSSGWIIGLGLLGILATFMFAAYLPETSSGLSVFITFVAMFSITLSVCARISGQLNSWIWWQHIILPFLTSSVAFIITIKANSAISPSVVNYARSLISGDALTLAFIMKGAITFAGQINSEYMQWMGFVMLAFVCATISVLCAFFQCVHYVALANAQHSSSPTWGNIASWTMRFSGWKSAVTPMFFLCFGWFAATGQLYAFVH